MKVALVHYWLVNMRGGERVLEALCRMFPDADIYTHVYDPDAVSDVIRQHDVHTTFISKLPMPRRLYKKYLPLMPLALESLDLTDYDLIISNESGPTKGIVPGPHAIHINYCCSPMRYIWDHYHIYRKHAGRLTRLVMPIFAHYLRIWDIAASTRVDAFIADSNHVAKRINKFYRRDADVVFPPVAIDEFSPAPKEELGDYYLWAGELVQYKRPDIAIEAFRRTGRKLLVIGDGEERKALQKVSGENISFLGKTSFIELKHHFARCRALIFPGEEDFGIVPVEVQAAGRPVIALGRGGVLDTVIDGKTGILFDDPTVEGLINAIERFEASGLEHNSLDACVHQAKKFSGAHFQNGILKILKRLGVEMTS